MTYATHALDHLHRPRILVRAARAGIGDYRRDRDIKRLLRVSKTVAYTSLFNQLVTEEARLEERRVSGDATYSIQRHVGMLTALLAEARHMPAERLAA